LWGGRIAQKTKKKKEEEKKNKKKTNRKAQLQDGLQTVRGRTIALEKGQKNFQLNDGSNPRIQN